jgi:ribonuclease HI
MITIYTDGSARGNPGPGGWGAIVAGDTVREVGGREEHTTNNRMELIAAIEALKIVQPSSDVELHSDSSYVVKGITEWIHGWRAKGWKTAGKKPVLNQDLWETLFEVIQDKNIHWKLVAGHAGVKANERCDEIATTLADNLPIALYDGPRAQYKYL